MTCDIAHTSVFGKLHCKMPNTWYTKAILIHDAILIFQMFAWFHYICNMLWQTIQWSNDLCELCDNDELFAVMTNTWHIHFCGDVAVGNDPKQTVLCHWAHFTWLTQWYNISPNMHTVHVLLCVGVCDFIDILQDYWGSAYGSSAREETIENRVK